MFILKYESFSTIVHFVQWNVATGVTYTTTVQHIEWQILFFSPCSITWKSVYFFKSFFATLYEQL